MRAVVIGGGVGALATVVALAQAGVESVACEQAGALRVGGGALLLWSNAVAVLDSLGLGEAVRSVGAPLETVDLRSRAGETLTWLDVGAIGRRAGAPSLVVHRSALLSLLARAAGARLRLGARCVAIADRAGGVEARLADGTTERGDVLVGADGLRSVVRAHLFGDEPLRRLRQLAAVGIATAAVPLLSSGAAFASAGDGLRFWAAPVGASETYWYATLPERDEDGDRPPPSREALRRCFRGWHAPVEALLDATDERTVAWTSIRDRRPARRWGTGRVTLLGDAAHPCTPDLGQGACQAIESAFVLARQLARAPTDGEGAALRAYERERMTRTARVTQLSWLTATLSASAEPSAVALREAGVRIALRPVALPQLEWLLAHRTGA